MTRRTAAFLAMLLLAVPRLASAQPGPPPVQWALLQNYPDAFCPDTSATHIAYDVSATAIVSLDVMDAAMRRVVRALFDVDHRAAPGHHQVTWDGRDSFGAMLRGGAWPYRLVARDTTTGDTLFVAVRVATIDCAGVVSVPAPGIPRLPDFAPGRSNPFHDRTSIALSLPQPREVTLRIYDLAGRAVRTLLSGRQPAGSVTVEWDGRSDLGRQVPAGVYVCVLRAGDVVRAQKLLRVRG